MSAPTSRAITSLDTSENASRRRPTACSPWAYVSLKAPRLGDEGIQAAQDVLGVHVAGEILQDHPLQHLAIAHRRQLRPCLGIAVKQHEATNRRLRPKRRQLVGIEV